MPNVNLTTIDDLVFQFGRQIEALAEAAPEVQRVGGSYVCPCCHAEQDEWIEYDFDVRQNVGEVWQGEHGGSGLDFSGSDADFQHLLYACGACRNLVNIPDTFDVSWS